MSSQKLITADQDLFDKIESYYRGSNALSAKESEICERWELAFALLLQHRNKKIAVSKFQALQLAKGSSLSLAQSYKDFAAAEKLFLPLKKYSKEFLRLVIIESAMRDIKEADEKAKLAKDAKSWSMIKEIKHRAELRIVKAAGLELEDPNIPDFSKLQFNQVNINVDSRVQSMFSTLLAKGVIDVSTIYENLSENETPMDNTTEKG